MKANNIIKGLCLCLLALGTTACEDKLDIAQHGVLNYDTFYNTDDEAESAAAAIYLTVRSLNYNYMMGKNMLTDDFWAGGGGRNDNAQLEQLNEFTFGTDQDFLQSMFSSYYSIIYKCNVVLGHVSEETTTMQRVRAEAKVLRAWAYFELTSMWGNPPIVDHELQPEEYSQPNATSEELWSLIETDLTEAINSGLLKEKSSVDDQTTWQVTKQYAEALLGKAYLWQKKYAEAAEQLNKVVDSGKYKLYDGDYADILQYEHNMNCESVFESVRIDDPNNVWDNFDMTYLMIHWRTAKMNITDEFMTQGWGFLSPQKSLYDEFVADEGTDGYRLKATMKTYDQLKEEGVSLKSGESVISEGYFMWKWRVTAASAPSAGYQYTNLQNPRWMRYAEVLLLAAEANLEAGNTQLALQDLNQVRERAKLADKTSITLADIQTEKRLELCGEGTRYQDLVRWGIAYDKLKSQGEKCPTCDSNGNVTYTSYNSDPEKYGFKQGKHELLPYPGTEIRLNSAIKQNPGW